MESFSKRLFVLLSVLLMITATLNPMIEAFALDVQNASVASNESDLATVADTTTNNSQQHFLDSQPDTNISANDHDGDSLSDSSKAKNDTGQSKKDSDDDGLDDDSEARLGTNPHSRDSDGDGVPDAKEKYTRKFKNETAGVEATICGEGDVGKNLSIGVKDKPSPLVSSLSGVYKIADVTPHVNISWAYVKIYYDPAELPDPANYSMFLFDSSKNTIEPIKEQGVNLEEHYYWGNLTHLSNPFIANPQLAYQDWLVNWEKPEHVFKAGEAIRIKANVHNNGGASASNAVVKFWENDNTGVLIDSVTAPLIPAGGSAIVYTTWTVRSNVNGIYVGADPSNLIVETSESNNNAWKEFYKYIDSDGDGLTDYEEINGMRRAFPNEPVYTNPNMWDTDNDGLSDGVEMGFIVRDELNRQFYAQYQIQYGWPCPYDGNHFVYLSNPCLPDSDFDDADDPDEFAANTNPLVPDSQVSAVDELILGFLLGDLVSDDPAHGNIPFFAGNIAAGLCPFWEWVNTGEGVIGYGSNGDVPMATVTAGTGLISVIPIPLIVDELPEIGAKASRFATHHVTMVGKAAQFLVRTLGDYSIVPLKFLYGNSASILGNRGLTDEYLKVLADCGTSRKVLDDLATSGIAIRSAFKDARGLVVRVEKSGLNGEIRYIDSGGQLLSDLDLVGKSRGEIGEIVGSWCLGENGIYRAVGFIKRNAYTSGPDDIVIENADDFIVENEFDDVQTIVNALSVAEYKFFTRNEYTVIDSSILSVNSRSQRQLSNGWITGSFDKLSQQNRLTGELEQQIQANIDANTLGRPLVLVENGDFNGLTVDFESLKNVGVTEFYIVKMGMIL